MIYGRPDPQDAAPVGYCPNCGGEVYPGEVAYPITYNYVHRACWKEWRKSHPEDGFSYPVEAELRGF